MSDGSLFLFGSVVSFTALAGAYVFLRTSFQRRTVKEHEGEARQGRQQRRAAREAQVRSM